MTAAFRASLPIATAVLVGGVACGGSGTRVRHEETGAPATYEGTVTRASGSAPAEAGASCRLEVSEVEGPVFNCRVRVLCGAEVLYGLPEAGFNRCRAEQGVMMAARDDGGTRRDGDPKMAFDLEQGRVVISDRDPDMELVIQLSRRGPPSGMVPEAPPGYAPGPGDEPGPGYGSGPGDEPGDDAFGGEEP